MFVLGVRGEDKILTGGVPFQCQQNPDGVSIPNTYIPPNQCLLPHITTYSQYIHLPLHIPDWSSYKSLRERSNKKIVTFGSFFITVR